MDNKLLLEAFNDAYQKGSNAIVNKKYDIASSYFYQAAELSLKLAKRSTGNIKVQRMNRGEELFLLAERCKEEYLNNNAKANVNNVTKDLAKFSPIYSKNAKEDEEPTISFEPSEKTGVMLSDVAGLQSAKDAIESMVLAPLKYPELREKYKVSKGGGILLYGVPGTGKTMFAQAIANELDADFFSIKCSDIASKWFGDSEQKIKALFDEARKRPFSIIFFDEFEALGAKRDSHSTVMKRLVPELLSQIQGFEKSENTLLLIAATNRPWDIDSAFTRPGRFNTKIYVPLPDEEARKTIISKKLCELPLADDLDLDNIVQYTDKFNGSDVVEFCEKLRQLAFQKAIKTKSDEPITNEMVEKVKTLVKSSVRKEDLDKISKFEQEVDF